MAVYGKKSLVTLYERKDDDAATSEKQLSEAWGTLTRHLNEAAYAALLLAFWYLGVFVGWNWLGR